MIKKSKITWKNNNVRVLYVKIDYCNISYNVHEVLGNQSLNCVLHLYYITYGVKICKLFM